MAVADAILGRSRRLLKAKKLEDFRATNVELLGAEHTYGKRASSITKEIVLRISVHHMSPAGLKLFGKEVAPVSIPIFFSFMYNLLKLL